jgi:hypothetical protein
MVYLLDAHMKFKAMKRTNIIFPLGMTILLFLAFACKKDEPSTVDFSMKAADSNAPATSSNHLPGFGSSNENLSLAWNTAWIYITNLEFNADFYEFSIVNDKDKSPDFHYVWQGIEKIDLLTEPKIFARMNLPEGQFKTFMLTLTSARFGFSNEPNFYLAGTYGPALGGTPIAVSVTHEFDMKLDYSSGEAISNDKGDIFNSVVELSLDKVFSGITSEELNNAELTDGWILISESHNQDLYVKILNNLLGKQSDGVHWDVHKIT